MLNESAVGVDRHRAHLHVERNRAAAGEIPAELPVGGLVQHPPAAFEPGVEDLREAVGVKLVVRDNRALLDIETEHHVSVDRTAADRDGINDFTAGESDGQPERLAAACLPMNPITAARVTNLVGGGAVRRFAPDPAEVPPPVRPIHGAMEVCVLAAFPVQQRLVEQPSPGSRRHIVNVVDLVAIAARAVAIGENQLAVRTGVEPGIGRAPLILAGHGRDPLQRLDLQRLLGSKIHQRRRMHIPAQVQVPLRIQRQCDVVVAIPRNLLRQTHPRPVGLRQAAHRDGHLPLGVVECEVLPVAGIQGGETDRMSRPNRRNIQRAFDLLRARCQMQREQADHEPNENARRSEPAQGRG